jgi:Ca2+-binding RTX toxin-like protein
MAHIIGTEGDDTLFGTIDRDTIEGHGGNDRLDGGFGNDNLRGGQGNDFLFGGNDIDNLDGGEGDDTLAGGDGIDFLFDTGGGNDVLDGGDGDDDMSGGLGDDFLIGGDGNDGMGWGQGNDTLLGGDGDDQLQVEAFFGIARSGHLDGGDGIDTLHLSGGTAIVNLETGVLHLTHFFSGEPVTATLEGIENVSLGFAGDALIIGNDANNDLRGGDGDDTLVGGLGNDSLIGGYGQNTFVFNVAPGEADADFLYFHDGTFEQGVGPDTIVLDSSVMPDLAATGDFSAEDERFYAAAGATGGAEEDDRVVFDTDTGRLYYDADGSGAGEALLVANLYQPFAHMLHADGISVI